MKYFLVILITLFCFLKTESQNVVVAATKMNVVYALIDNPLSILAENIPCDSIYVVTDNGKITKFEADCSYNIYVEKGYISNLTIYKISGNDTVEISKYSLRIKFFPELTCTIAGSKGGNIKKEILLCQSYIRSNPANFEINIEFTVTNYSVKMYRRGKRLIYEKEFDGNLISEELKNEILKLRKNDVIEFEIYTTTINSEYVNNITFTIE